MPNRGHRAFALLFMVLALPLSAQTQDEKIQQLQKRLDELLQQATSIQSELNVLKGTTPAPEEEDLTKVGVVAPAAPSTAARSNLPRRQLPRPSTATVLDHNGRA